MKSFIALVGSCGKYDFLRYIKQVFSSTLQCLHLLEAILKVTLLVFLNELSVLTFCIIKSFLKNYLFEN